MKALSKCSPRKAPGFVLEPISPLMDTNDGQQHRYRLEHAANSATGGARSASTKNETVDGTLLTPSKTASTRNIFPGALNTIFVAESHPLAFPFEIKLPTRAGSTGGRTDSMPQPKITFAATPHTRP